MNSAQIPRFQLGNLSLASPLGKGGQGQVTAVTNILLNKKWPAVLKEYSPGAKRALQVSALETIAAFPQSLAYQDGLWLNENTAWPVALVEDNGQVCGFLMRSVPPEFYFDFQTMTMGTQKKLADVAFLLNHESYVHRSGIMLTNQNRLALLGKVASTLSRLHAADIVIGDFSPKNVLFSFSPSPQCFLIDCDAVRVRGCTVLDQTETPDWEVPAGEPRATPATDAYKFGLLAIRLFAQDQSSRDPAALAATAPELGHLAQLSQHPDPRWRPPPDSWITALRAAASATVATRARPAAPPPTAPLRDPVPAPAFYAAPRPASPPAPVQPPPAPARQGTGGCLLALVCMFAIAAAAAGVLIHNALSPSASAAQPPGIGSMGLMGGWPDREPHTSATPKGHRAASPAPTPARAAQPDASCPGAWAGRNHATTPGGRCGVRQACAVRPRSPVLRNRGAICRGSGAPLAISSQPGGGSRRLTAATRTQAERLVPGPGTRPGHHRTAPRPRASAGAWPSCAELPALP